MTTTIDPEASPQRVELRYLTAAASRACEEGRHVLDELSASRPVTVREVGLLSDEGRRLVNEGRVPFAPAVFLGDRLLAQGCLSCGELERQLDGDVAGAPAR